MGLLLGAHALQTAYSLRDELPSREEKMPTALGPSLSPSHVGGLVAPAEVAASRSSPGAAEASLVSVVLADKQPLVLEGLDHVLTSTGRFVVRARCSEAAEVVEALGRLRPDLLVLDLHLTGECGLDLIRELRDADVPTRIVVLSSRLDEKEALACLRAGVAGIIMRDMPAPTVAECIEQVAYGQTSIDGRCLGIALGRLARERSAAAMFGGALTAREREVLLLCVSGATNREIAQALSLAEGTVKLHLHHVFTKLGVRSRAELTRFAFENALV